jgi:hypothetical protein
LNGLLRLDGQLLPLEWHDTSLDANWTASGFGPRAARLVERNLQLV